MLKAERQARHSSQNLPTPAAASVQSGQGSAINALLPIFVLVLSLISGLMLTGEGSNLREILGTADSYKALMWSSFLGVMSAGIITLLRTSLVLNQVVEAWVEGMKTTFEAMVILVLSWALATVTQELNTSKFLISFLGDSISLALLPTLSFILAGVIALATGTSWGTMGDHDATYTTFGLEYANAGRQPCHRTKPHLICIYRFYPGRGDLGRPLLSYFRHNSIVFSRDRV